MLPSFVSLFAADVPRDSSQLLADVAPQLLPALFALFGLGAGLLIGVWVLRSWRQYLSGRMQLEQSGGAVNLALLEQLGVAPRPELEAMSPRERQFMLEMVVPKLLPPRDAPPADRPEGVAPAEPRLSIFGCPACGAQAVASLAAPLHTTRCHGCRRRITLRVDPSGVFVEADEDGPRP